MTIVVQLVILADDLTGAADTGGAFAQAGWPTRLAFGETTGGDASVLVRSTESRGTCRRQRRRPSIGARRPPSRRRTPRLQEGRLDAPGAPGAELLAVMAGLGESRALVAPALPARGADDGGWMAADRGCVGRPGIDLMAMFGRRQDLPVTRLDLATVRQGRGAVARAIDRLACGHAGGRCRDGGRPGGDRPGAFASGIRVVAGAAGLARQLAS